MLLLITYVSIDTFTWLIENNFSFMLYNNLLLISSNNEYM